MWTRQGKEAMLKHSGRPVRNLISLGGQVKGQESRTQAEKKTRRKRGRERKRERLV